MKAHVHASVLLSSIGTVDWSVGHNVSWSSPEPDDLLAGAKGLVMSWAGSATTRALEFAAQRAAIADSALEEQDFETFFGQKIEEAVKFRNNALTNAPNTLGAICDVVVGQDLTMSALDPGKAVFVSGSMYNNGITGTYDLGAVLVRLWRVLISILIAGSHNRTALLFATQEPPFITVSLQGTPGLAFVHTQPCAVLKTCLVLKPVVNLDDTRAEEEKLADMFLIAALITSNSWRFNYLRKCMAERIADLPLDAVKRLTAEQRAGLVAQVAHLLPVLKDVQSQALPTAVQ